MRNRVRGVCSFPDCEREQSARGLCKSHYMQGYYGRALATIKTRGPNRRGCVIPGCDRKHNAHGYCRTHYEIKLVFDMAPEEFERILAAQGGVCAICREVCNSRRRLSVDHDHASDVIRGLLCARCNRAIGLFRDDPALLEVAATYLRRDMTLDKVSGTDRNIDWSIRKSG